VLSADPLTVDESRIAEIVADVTIVGGRVVHSEGDFVSLPLEPARSLN
jgi:predicted amidohydrolase YtcJ